MSLLRALRIVLALVFCLTVSFGGASRAEDEDAPAAPAAGSPETDAESEADPLDESEADPVDDPGAEESAIAASQRDDVEELFVTATKREESLQDVPISMSALNAGFLDDAGLTKFAQLQEYVPNLTINPVTDTRGTIIRIRGIGSTGVNAGIDPSVGVFIDGVYQGRAGMSVGDLLDIERVEVLRGPQGTLYGKNTAAGLINIISKRPVYEWEAIAEGVYGNFGNYEGRASVNIPIVDEHVAMRFSGYQVTRDGFDKRLNIGGRSDPPDNINDDWFIFEDGRVNDDNRWGTKARLLLDVMDNLSFLVTGDYSYQNTNCCVADLITLEGEANPNGDAFPNLWPRARFQKMAQPVATGGTGIPLPPKGAFDHLVTANQDPKNVVEIGGVALDGTYEFDDIPVLGGSVLNLIASWRTYASDSQFDGDFSYYDAVLAWTQTELDQYSAELRLASPGGEFVDYQTGLYFYHQDQDTLDRMGYEWDFVRVFIPGLMGEPVHNIGDNTHKTWSYAGFGQVTLNPSDLWSLTGGLRVTHEKKTRVGSQTSEPPQFVDAPPILGPDISRDEERSVTNVSGMASLRFFPTEDIMIYGSFATGFKSGGFNQLRTLDDPTVPAEFDDEESMNFELGTKTTWFERMLTLNVTGFYTDYDQFQALTFDGSSINVRNAGSLESYGVEGDLLLVPYPGLIFGTAVGFNIAKYKSFKLGEQTAEQRWYATFDDTVSTPDFPDGAGFPINCSGTGDPSLTFPDDCVQDLSGKRLDSAPDWSVSAFAQYEYLLPWLPLELFLRTEYAFSSTRYLAQDLDRNLKQNSTHIVNLRGGFRAEDKLWEVTGWVKNLADEEYNVVGFDVPILNGFAGINGPPRQYGVTLRLTF